MQYWFEESYTVAVTNAVCFYVCKWCTHIVCGLPAGNGLVSPCRARVCTSGCTSLLFRTGTPAFMGGREENTCERLRRMRGLWRRTTLIRCGIQFCEMTQDVGISLSLGQGCQLWGFQFQTEPARLCHGRLCIQLNPTLASPIIHYGWIWSIKHKLLLGQRMADQRLEKIVW